MYVTKHVSICMHMYMYMYMYMHMHMYAYILRRVFHAAGGRQTLGDYMHA